MIHTFTVKTQITSAEYWAFLECDGVQSYKDPYTSRWKMADRTLEEHGIVLYAVNYSIWGMSDYFCYELFVNPAKVIGRTSVVEIYETDQFNLFMQRFHELITQYQVEIPPLEAWKAHRIDFTKDIRTEHVDLYIKLFQKADLGRYKFPTDKHKNSTRYRPGSLYCKCKNHTINFYNKADEVAKEGTAEEVEQAKNVLRIEVQCKKDKIHALKNKFNLKNRSIIPFLLRNDIAADVISYYAAAVLGSGDYYKKNRAITMIKASNYKPGTKEAMISILNDIAAQYSSIDKVKPRYDNMYLQQFKNLGINLVTIDTNTKGVPMLKSIIELISEV